jgi:hypothetical protein
MRIWAKSCWLIREQHPQIAVIVNGLNQLETASAASRWRFRYYVKTDEKTG